MVANLRDTEAMLNAGNGLGAVLQGLEVSESTLDRWRVQDGGMKCDEAKRLKQLEDENPRLKQLVADQVTFSPFRDPSGMLGFWPLTSLERVGFR